VPQQTIFYHLPKMPALANPVNTGFLRFNYDQSIPTGVDPVPAYKPPHRFCLTWANTPSKLTSHFPFNIYVFQPIIRKLGE